MALLSRIDHPGRAYLALSVLFSPRRTERRGIVAAAARTCDNAHAGSRARARRSHARRLHHHRRAKRRAAEDADAGQARQADLKLPRRDTRELRERVGCVSRLRQLGAADRPRADRSKT